MGKNEGGERESAMTERRMGRTAKRGRLRDGVSRQSCVRVGQLARFDLGAR
jgi:hypothetical protein